MLNYIFYLAIFLQTTLGEFFEGVLEFGFWAIIIITIIAVVLIIWIVKKVKKFKKEKMDNNPRY